MTLEIIPPGAGPPERMGVIARQRGGSMPASASRPATTELGPPSAARPEAGAPPAPAPADRPGPPPRPAAGRAVIGDQLRIPVARCEAGGCGSWHADPAARGEADIRVQAVAAGWREDSLGRLACPGCQHRDGLFWAPPPAGLAGRQSGAARTVPAAARRGGENAAPGGGNARTGGVPSGRPRAALTTGGPGQHDPGPPAGRQWPGAQHPGRHRRAARR